MAVAAADAAVAAAVAAVAAAMQLGACSTVTPVRQSTVVEGVADAILLPSTRSFWSVAALIDVLGEGALHWLAPTVELK